MGPAATGSSISEAGVQYQEQDVVNDDRLQSPDRVASPASTTPNLPSNLPGNGWDSETTGKHLSSRRDTQPQRNRITSNTGIQTIPDKDVDWLGDLGAEDSMSAIDISRIWAEQRSGPKPSQEPDRSREPGSEPDEPLTGNFLDEAEDPSVDRDEVSKDLSTVEPAEAIANLNEFGREEEQGRDFDPDISGRAPALPFSPVGSFSPSQVAEPSITNPVSSPPRFSSPPPREAISDDPHSSVKPYPFNLQTHKLASTSVHPNTDASVSQVDAQHRPISLSQPNPATPETYTLKRATDGSNLGTKCVRGSSTVDQCQK
ncbi:hypothetical protein BN14_07916 [Rhizoctonia solani AG-1 IB]|uniref:Uncharacterized protein n=1 Tax=Thanatephorus cucumeris (strain AG1-IB / isolate 7/3/14) TaxID=1108050 RepID=M5C452_THACB|nr:hypothetical protein BN14_07916 [Rhizoctonia solani AG-1 IB]